MDHCDMSVSTATTCSVPVMALRAAPYNLDWGSSIFAKVIATNLYGDSLSSLAGNSAVITTKPDAPINLAENVSQRTKSTLALTWQPAAFTGGAPIIDYRVMIATQGETFFVLASGLSSPAYKATGLVAGLTYEFKVLSRNSYSYSSQSEAITLLCAFVPDPPVSVTTANSNELVAISWGNSITNGSPIIAYKVFVR